MNIKLLFRILFLFIPAVIHALHQDPLAIDDILASIKFTEPVLPRDCDVFKQGNLITNSASLGISYEQGESFDSRYLDKQPINTIKILPQNRYGQWLHKYSNSDGSVKKDVVHQQPARSHQLKQVMDYANARLKNNINY